MYVSCPPRLNPLPTLPHPPVLPLTPPSPSPLLLPQIVMGVFIVSFIGNSFITSTIDAPWLQWVSRGNR